MTRRVWLNLNTGEFSNSWEKGGTYDLVDEEMLNLSREKNWKLIEYQCLNDDSFELYNMMKIVTNIKS